MKSKKKKNCQKGYSCGFTCINIQKVCLVEFPDGVSASLKDRSIIRSYPINTELSKPEITLSIPQMPVVTAKPKRGESEEEFAKKLEKIIKESKNEAKEYYDKNASRLYNKRYDEMNKFEIAYESDTELYTKLSELTSGQPTLPELTSIYKEEKGILPIEKSPPPEVVIEHFKDRIGQDFVDRFKKLVGPYSQAQKEVDDFEKQYEYLKSGGNRVRDLKSRYRIPSKYQSVKESPMWDKEPYSQWKKDRDKELEEKRNMLVNTYGEELVKKAEDRVKKLLNNSELTLRMTPKVVDILVNGDGRLKSQFETGTSNGLLDTDFRREVENGSLGVSTSDNTLRPIYGYFTDRLSKAEHSDGSLQYGEIKIVFNNDLKNRTTVTGNDSLGEYGPPYGKLTASSVGEQFNIASLFKWGITENNKPKRDILEKIADGISIGDIVKSLDSLYLEAQIFGQPNIKEAVKIIYTSGYEPSASVKKWAEDNGIEIVMED